MRLSIVIVNYNTGDYLKKCLDSIEAKFGGVEYETIVIDNASTDGSADCAEGRTACSLTKSDKNLGFAAGCNLGAKTASGEMILFLNPDTRILSDNITELLESFGKNEKAGALGCQNRLPDGSLQTSAYSFPTLFLVTAYAFRLRELLKLPGLKPALSPILKGKFGQFSPHDKPREVDYVTGAFLLVKRESWRSVGEFDEKFFLFCEEIDWCRRLKESGMEVLFDPSFEIEHHVGYSSSKVPERVMVEKIKSYLVYFRKHHGQLKLYCLKFIFGASIRFWTAYYKITGNNESYDAYKRVAKNLV